MRQKEIYNPVLNYYLVVFKGHCLEKAKKYAEKKLDCVFTIEKGMTACVFRVSGCKNQVVWFRDKRPEARIVTHEAFHTVYHVLKEERSSLIDETEEVFAYLLDWTFEEIRKSK